MSRKMVSLGISLVGSAVVSIAMFACSSDNKSSSTDAGNGATTGGATSTGGSASSTGGSTTTGGSTGSGGTTALPDAAMLYPCYSQPPHDPGGSAAVGAACCGGLGTCGLASSLTGPAASSYAHDSCKASSGADDLKCAPTPASLSDAGTAGIFDTCQADFGGGIMLEGRCLPSCFIQGNPQASLLSQGSCAAADAGGGPQVCAPCYNPIDGTETGACSQKPGDKPKQAAPATFKGCGASDGGAPLGICVPAESVQRSGNAAAALLQQDDCAAKGDLCVPKLKADNLNSCFVKCQTASTTLSSFGAQYNDGACVPKYIVGDTQGATALAALVQSTCGQGELCAPCLNPLMSGMTTGACQ